ncbi:MAG: hypothetical protein WCG27_02600, partial [Pseudomonadota bacterium]
SDINEPALALDSCFRRAGSVCHSDLDCSPTKLHSGQAGLYSYTYFGGTAAEKQYWEEGLVCGQAASTPYITSTDYNNYDLTLNRCCRQVNSTLTMYTQGAAAIPALIPDLGTTNTSLVVNRYPKDDPTAAGRYSRYTTVVPMGSENNIATSVYPEIPRLETQNVGGVIQPKTPKKYQWKTFFDTGRKSCCGGTFIRKFKDGTHNWTKTDRLKFNISNFKCLNYETPLSFLDSDTLGWAGVNDAQYSQESNRMCLSPQNGSFINGVWDGGCTQRPIAHSSDWKTIVAPKFRTETEFELDTSPQSDGSLKVNSRAPYMPIPAISFPNAPAGFTPNYLASSDKYYYTSIYLPSYITENNIVGRLWSGIKWAGGTVALSRYKTDKTYISPDVTPTEVWTCDSDHTNLFDASTLADNQWCIQHLSDGRNVFHIRGFKDVSATPSWSYAGIKIKYYSLSTSLYFYNGGNTVHLPDNRGTMAGNDLYYLSKLGRLELLGIPQIFYEPIFCNSDFSKLVPGIFSTATDLYTDFFKPSFSFQFYSSTDPGKTLPQIYDSTFSGTDIDNPGSGAAGGYVAMQNKVQFPQIWSGHEFLCCRALGAVSASAGDCCSNFLVENSISKIKTCALPNGADLNLYFNRFISSDGTDQSLSNGGLIDSDFIAETGEPNFQEKTQQKIQELGMLYCAENNVTQGKAFGKFDPEPSSGFTETYGPGNEDYAKYWSIVDSFNDYNPDTLAGSDSFLAGYRWNHHWYCSAKSVK